MRTTWTFSSAGQLIFGSGGSDQLADVVARLKLSRMLIVSDARLVDAGIVAQVTTASAPPQRAKSSPAANRNRRWPRPSARSHTAARSSPTALVGLGGGSNMDLAKITAAVLAHGGSVRDYVGDDRDARPGAAR